MKTILRVVFALYLSILSLAVLSAPVNINTADEVALAENLNGVGPKIAAKIVKYREENGSFKSVDDLVNVKGIGAKILDRNRENILVGESKEAAYQKKP